jgi:hypothetical protein
MKGYSLAILLALLTVVGLVGTATSKAEMQSKETVWWATRANADNWLLERTLVTQLNCGTPTCDPPETLRYRSTVDSAICRGRGQHYRSRGVTYWHLFRCQVEATPIDPDALVPTVVELKPTGKRRFSYKVIGFDAP